MSWTKIDSNFTLHLWQHLLGAQFVSSSNQAPECKVPVDWRGELGVIGYRYSDDDGKTWGQSKDYVPRTRVGNWTLIDANREYSVWRADKGGEILLGRGDVPGDGSYCVNERFQLGVAGVMCSCDRGRTWIRGGDFLPRIGRRYAGLDQATEDAPAPPPAAPQQPQDVYTEHRLEFDELETLQKTRDVDLRIGARLLDNLRKESELPPLVQLRHPLDTWSARRGGRRPL